MKKMTQKMMAGTVAMAALCLGAGGLHAQVTNLVTFTATASVQGAYSYSNNAKTGITTYAYAAPTKVSVTTKTILLLMAQAENNEGKYASTTFPSGAKLVVISGNNNGPAIQVLDKNNNLLVDVSDILSVTNSGLFGANVQSGKYANGVASPTATTMQINSFNYDDTQAGGTTQFYLAGLFTNTQTDTTPNATTGAYKQTESHKMSSGAGDGNYKGNQLVVTGSISASGSGILNINNNN